MTLRMAEFLLTLLIAGRAFGADSFELSGTVLGEMGEGLSGATLTLVHETGSLVRTTTANASGHYSFPALRPGEYTLEVGLAGYATSRFAGLRYFADTKPVFNVTLLHRDVQKSMTFTGEAPLVNVSQSQVGLSVENRQLYELPLTDRDYLELVSLEGAARETLESPPGPPRPPHFGAPLLSVNGESAHYTAYELDGLGNTRDQHGVVHVDVDVDAVEEFRVISGQPSAEYGRSLGGLVTATTRSGGNDFHGSVFAYVRPGSWESADTLTGETTTSDRQEVGFTLSGPVASERTQFFTSFSYANRDEDVVVTAPYDEGQFRGVFTLPSERTRFLAKLSHLFNPRHQLSVKAALSNLDRVEGVGGLDIFGNRLETTNDDVAISGTLVSEMGSALGELRFGFSDERFRARGQAPPFGAVQIHPTEGNLGNPTRLERVDERHWELSETLALPAGNHSLKAGFDFLRIESESELVRYSDGLLHFAPADTERPILFWRSFTEDDASGPLARSESHVQLFVQDDWQLTPYVTVNLGLRWDKETSVPDNNNVAPRLGLHWDATGDGRTAIRAGYGVFYSFVFSIVDTLERLYGPGGRRVLALTPDDPGFAEGSPLDAASNFYVEAPAYAEEARRSPYAQHVTFGIEREIFPTWTAAFDVSYIRGSDLILPVDLNAPTFFDTASGATRSGAEADGTRPFGAPGAPIPGGVVDALPDGFPFDGYRDLYLLSSRGSSRYWSIKLNVTKRYATDYMIQTVYQWSRTRNDGDNYRVLDSLPLNPADPALEWGRSALDVPHALIVNGVWDAPFGLRLAGLARLRSGRAVDPRVDEDLDGDRKLRERASFEGRILERNSFRAPSTASLDLSLGKLWEVGEGRRIEASLAIFNVTNRLNPKQYLQSFGRDAASRLPTFLDIVQAAPPRRFELSMRFSF